MAELVVVVLGVSLQKVKSTALNHIDLMLGIPQQLNAMKRHVEAIEAVLADAESKKTGRDSHNRRVSLWLNNVSGVALEAEIVLDELFYENLRRQVLETNGGAQEEVCSSFLFWLESRIRDIYLSMMLGSRVQSINANFKEFNDQLKTLKLVSGEHHVTDHVAANRETNFATHRLVVGRVEEECEIVELLLDSSNHNSGVSVLPIFGLGGLGKTTLAKSVYNNKHIMDRFSKRSWTCVSNIVGCTDIFREILESLKGGESVEISQQDAIVQGIQKELRGERFLFVLDDVWDFEWWGNFLDAVTYMVGFNSTGGGCCVLITTRLEGVANEACASFRPFRLKKLSDDQFWSIIVERVKEGEKMVEGLEVYKEQLLKKCQGLPLTANVIGGLLSRKDWSLVVDRILKIQDDVDDKIMAILRLSYDYLPSRCLKSCFVYCSVYPKDTVMDGDKLIELWMAQGYLQEGVEGGRTMEEVGAGYLSILLQSSLLEKCYKKDSLRYQMHDLVHDLAESLSREKHVGGELRHFELGDKRLKYKWNEKSKLAGIEEGDICDAMLSKYIHARVMHLHLSREIKILANNVGMLIHVRSLSISGSGIESLPESLCRLYILQTLNLSDCAELQCLPQGLSNLISLRHLCCDENEKLKMAPNMGRLTRLQTLELFNVGEENGHKIEELGFMENLKGSLRIRNLELVKGKEEATSAKLFNKKNMTKLELEWGSTRRNSDNWEDERVLEGLEPCPGLQELGIKNYMGVRFPRWLGKLSALVHLELHGCENMRELGYSGDTGFPYLKTLHIEGCGQLSSVRTSFPILEKLDVKYIQVLGVRNIISKSPTNSLKYLKLCGVRGMTSLSDVIESSVLFSCLRRLDIRGCDELTEMPSSALECCTCLESLEVYLCRELVSFPLNLQQTPCLSQIELLGCPKLFTRDAILPRGFEHLTNLKELRFGPDSSQQSIDWDGLRKGCSTTLRGLEMLGSARTQLPQQLQDFSSLVELTISEFGSLERLPGWLGKLTSLQRLQLYRCPILEHLPTDAIGSLTNLQRLQIGGCPLLRETQRDEIKKALPNLQVYWTDY